MLLLSFWKVPLSAHVAAATAAFVGSSAAAVLTPLRSAVGRAARCGR